MAASSVEWCFLNPHCLSHSLQLLSPNTYKVDWIRHAETPFKLMTIRKLVCSSRSRIGLLFWTEVLPLRFLICLRRSLYITIDLSLRMMTSPNGNIFRVTGPLCGEFTGTGVFHAQRPLTRSFDVFFDLRLNKRLSKQPWGWWFETSSWSLRRQSNGKGTGNHNRNRFEQLLAYVKLVTEAFRR